MLQASIDTETTGTDAYHGCKPFMVGICDGTSTTIYEGDVNPYTRDVFWEEDELCVLQQHIDKLDIAIFHNTQFDLRMLSTIDIDISKIWEKAEDTLLASHLFASGEDHSLEYLVQKYLNWWDTTDEDVETAVKAQRAIAGRKGFAIAKQGHPHFPAVTSSGAKWWKQDMWLAPEETQKYLAADCEKTFALWEAFKTQLNKDQLWQPYKLRKQLLKICYDITDAGQRIDPEKINAYLTKLERKMEKLKKYLRDKTHTTQKFNWNTKGHLTTLLHNYLNIPIIHTTSTGQPATNQKAIDDYAQMCDAPEIKALQIGRLLETKHRYAKSYLTWADENYRIHSNLNVTGTRETRQSSSAPNQQNITKELKALFIPPPGYVWVEIDFKNIELRIWAYSVGNQELIDSFEKGLSVHFLIMEALYPKEAKQYAENPNVPKLAKLYRDVKAGNFAIIYGATERKADETYGYPGATQKVYRRFPGVLEYTQSLIRQCEQNMWDLGRHCVFTLCNYPLDVPTDEPFKACNYYTQGSAGILMTLALIAVSKNRRFIDSESKLISQVHDSTTPEIPIHPGLLKTVQSITHTMETCALDVFGPTPVDWDVKINPLDKDNPHVQELQLWPLPF